MREDQRFIAPLLFRERQALRLAGIGQTVVALAVLALFLSVESAPMVYWPLSIVSVFAVLGLVRVVLSRVRRHHVSWVFPVVFVEACLVAFAILYPNPFLETTWPRTLSLRLDNQVFFALLIAGSAFTYRPRLVVWTGFCCALAWGLGVTLVVLIEQPLHWDDVATSGMTATQFRAFYLNERFIDYNNHIKEVAVMLLASGLIASAVARARRVVHKELSAHAYKMRLQTVFGRFVPQDISQRLVTDVSLPPVKRPTAILFVDIEGFTGLCERIDSEQLFRLLNEFFACVEEVVVKHGGLVISHQGDAILAAYNLPSELDGFERAALNSAEVILQRCVERRFADLALNVRIGVARGEATAGLVGGSGRLSYTVYGEVVNRAARLVEAAKRYEMRMLVDGEIAAHAPDPALRALGQSELRGCSHPVELWGSEGPSRLRSVAA